MPRPSHAPSASPLHLEAGPTPFLLEARGLSKQFPGVRALDDVALTLARGEVVAVIGENGAGKSTLMKILAGVERPDQGEIRIGGEPVELDSPGSATRLGIALIHQELNLADNLDVGANIFLGREPRRLGWIDRAAIDREARRHLGDLELTISPRRLVSTLAIGQQQLVEIAKALSVSARILIMDEPTSSLSRGETARLFEVVDRLRSRGVSIVYISHRLGEVTHVADRVVVLRDGRNAGELVRHEIEHDRMVRLMVGRHLERYRVQAVGRAGAVLLEADQLRTAAHPDRPVSFQLRAGEIVGVAGLIGAGRTELVETLFGLRAPAGGRLLLGGRPFAPRSPIAAIRAGLALVPEDRKQQGLILEMTVGENLGMARLGQDQRLGIVDERRVASLSRTLIRQLAIRTPSARQVVQLLSGGNQQKVVVGKWLATKPHVLLLDEPTRGVDVGAKQEIYQLMEELAARETTILFISSEMEEILRMSHRALVMHEGRIAGELARDELTEEAVMRLATGAETAGADAGMQPVRPGSRT